MTCDQWFEPVSAWVDGELGAAEAEAVEAHLAACAHCHRLSDRLSDLRRRVLVHLPCTPPDLPLDTVEAAIAERPATRALVQRTLVAAAALVVVAGIAVPLARTRPDQATNLAIATRTVEADQQMFDQGEVDVATGSTVRWQNRSHTTHHLVREVDGGTVASPLAPGQVDSVTFDAPGIYRYFCTIHKRMTGTVVVES